MRIFPSHCEVVNSDSARCVRLQKINLFSSMASQLASGNTELLAETHAVSAGLKSYVTARIIDAMETGRRAMGGHGFMHSAAVGQLYAANLPGATYEGDSTYRYWRNPRPRDTYATIALQTTS